MSRGLLTAIGVRDKGARSLQVGIHRLTAPSLRGVWCFGTYLGQKGDEGRGSPLGGCLLHLSAFPQLGSVIGQHAGDQTDSKAKEDALASRRQVFQTQGTPRRSFLRSRAAGRKAVSHGKAEGDPAGSGSGVPTQEARPGHPGQPH